MGITDPAKFPTAWDVAVIGGEATRGIAEISGANRPWKWDVQKAYGSAGPATVLTGEGEQKFTLKITFWDGVDGYTEEEQREHFYDVIVPLLEKTTNGKAAVDFYHPACSEPPINIKAVSLAEVGQLLQVFDGVWAVEVQLIKFSKPKPKYGKPKAAASKKDQPVVKDAADKEIDALVAQMKALA